MAANDGTNNPVIASENALEDASEAVHNQGPTQEPLPPLQPQRQRQHQHQPPSPSPSPSSSPSPSQQREARHNDVQHRRELIEVSLQQATAQQQHQQIPEYVTQAADTQHEEQYGNKDAGEGFSTQTSITVTGAVQNCTSSWKAISCWILVLLVPALGLAARSVVLFLIGLILCIMTAALTCVRVTNSRRHRRNEALYVQL